MKRHQFSTNVCQYHMNITGIRIFAEFPEYINMHDLRAQDRNENKSLLNSNLKTETDSS